MNVRMARLKGVWGAAAVGRRAWSGRRRAAVTWRPSIVVETLVGCDVVVYATAVRGGLAGGDGVYGGTVGVCFAWCLGVCAWATRDACMYVAGEFELRSRGAWTGLDVVRAGASCAHLTQNDPINSYL